jgi:glycosyltransferase involved in cell wall biosynthesis
MSKVILLFGSRNLSARHGHIVDWLVSSGYRVTLLALPRSTWQASGMEIDPRDLDVGCCTIRLKETRLVFIPNIVICCNWSVLPLAIAFKFVFGTKVMYDENDFQELMFKAIGNWTQRHVTSFMARLLKRLFVPFLDLVTCVNLKDNLLQRELMKYNPNVIELDNYPTARWQANGEPAELAGQPLKFAFLGRITEQKGCKTCGEAFLRATRESPVFRGSELHYFGTWGDQDLVDWLRSQDGISVRMMVSPGEIRSFFRNNRCVGLLLYGDSVYTEWTGKNTLKIYEYLAMGSPVISTRVGDLPRFITEHDVGYVVGSPLTCDELTALFVRISENPDELQGKGQNAKTLMSREGMRWEAQWDKVLRTGFFNENGR